YKAPEDIADSFGKNKTNIKTDLIIKANDGIFGSFRDLRNKNIGNIIEIIEDKCDAMHKGKATAGRIHPPIALK
ncbi:hypothetical protein GFJ88_22725, partial [Salmonella enterica subsp. enterica serovar Enteritidis]|nr:hypothetical protein [Salmonella enterica subsp. enterica serovar Enteritidis]